MRWDGDVDASSAQLDFHAPRQTQRTRAKRAPPERLTRPNLADPHYVRDLVHQEFLPRVARAHKKPVASGHAARLPVFSRREILKFADLSAACDLPGLCGVISKARDRGISLETLYLDLMQPAARQLGDRWAADTCDFATVTLGLCQMHHVLRDLSPDFVSERTGSMRAHHVLLVPGAGEQHTFGLVMLSEFFRRAGWIVSSGPFASLRALGTAVQTQWFAVVGFSLSCDAGIDAVAAQVAAVRARSCNRSVKILVGGRVFNDQPGLVARVGADGTAQDAREAVWVSRTTMEDDEARTSVRNCRRA